MGKPQWEARGWLWSCRIMCGLLAAWLPLSLALPHRASISLAPPSIQHKEALRPCRVRRLLPVHPSPSPHAHLAGPTGFGGLQSQLPNEGAMLTSVDTMSLMSSVALG